jgi:hypothetical protein
MGPAGVERWWCGIPVSHLRDDVVKFCLLIAEAGQRKLGLGLGKPRGWPFCPERRKPYDYSGYLRWLHAVRYLHSSLGSPLWDHSECSCCEVSPLNVSVVCVRAVLHSGYVAELSPGLDTMKTAACCSYCLKSHASAPRIDCTRKLAVYGGRLGQCWRPWRERSRSQRR